VALDPRHLLGDVRGWIRNVDWTLLIVALALTAIGIVSIWGASRNLEETSWLALSGFARRQTMWAVIAIVAMVVTVLVPYRFYCRFGYSFYLLALAALVFVLQFGEVIHGSRRWISLGFATVQPSEFAKLAFVFALARYLPVKVSQRHWWVLVPPLALAAGLMVLILLEPDLGSALVFAPVLFALLFVAGVRKRHLILLAAAPFVLLAALWLCDFQLRIAGHSLALHSYQKDRLLAFIDPEAHASGAGYSLIQSLVAVCSGGLWGKGLGRGVQGQLGFLPARDTDFIFSCIAEQWGFVGAIVVLGLFVYLVLACAALAKQTRDPAGRLLIVGVMTLLASQALINTAMTIRLAPITGLPLPFVSRGGSSLVANFIALGVVLNVASRQSPVLSREDFQ